MIENKKLYDRIVKLEAAYKGDKEALDEIARAKETIEYYEQRGELDKAESTLNNLGAFLNDWY